MQIKLPPSVPYEKRLDNFKNAIANQIEYASKNQTWTGLGQGGKGQVGSLSVDVEGMASKYGVKPDEAEKIYRQLKNKSSLAEAFTKGADELKSLASKKTDLPSDYAKLAEKYGGKTSDWVNESSKYLKDFSKDVAKEMAPSSLAEKYKAAENASIERGAKKLLSGNVGKAAPYELSVLEKFIRPAGGAIAGAVEAIPPINKYLDKEPTASMAEAALSPEGSKGIARGVGAVAGMEAGAELGAMSPVLKGPATLAGAVGGSMVGAKLGDLLTGIPAIDKAIEALYEKELRKREAKMMAETESSSYSKNPRMADAPPRNMELRSEE